jgi:serine/threonine protein kinase/tetratricopeptide (TPR) repeat protein
MMQSAAARDGDRRPERIGPYRIVGALGEGGMGVVYRAVHHESGAPVALKTVHTSNERMLSSIRREVHALSRLNHPGVVRVVGEGVDHAQPWYAMELLEGLTLLRLARSRWGAALASAPTMLSEAGGMPGVGRSGEFTVREGTGSTEPGVSPEALIGQPAAAGNLPEALTLIRRLCVPLSFLHGEGIVHRDLKPENVFIRPGDVPVLVDFGLVASFEGTSGREALELAGATMGTPAYMAPEQVRGEVVDARADLYALGCLLYELVTGRVPFIASNTLELVGKHLLATPTRPSELVTGVPAALDDLILRLLAKNPRERIGHADDVAAALIALGADAAHGYDVKPPEPRAYLYRPGFTGRDEVFRKLRARIDGARNGQGAVMFVAGESGVGKTRLATEAGRAATGQSLRAIASECTPFNVAEQEGADYNGAPLHPFVRVLEAVADRCQEFGPAETARLLGPRCRVLAPYAPALTRAPGFYDFPEAPSLSAEAGRQRLFRDLAETLAAFAADRGLFILLDDLQWSDELTLTFLESLPAAYFEENPVVFLGTWRSEEATDALRRLAAMPHADAFELTRMDETAVGEIVAAMLAMQKAPDGFVRFLTEQSEGNPFFVAEYLRTALAEKLIYRDLAGHWRLLTGDDDTRASLERLPLPRSLRDLVTRRLDGLPEACWHLVEVASVLGRDVQGDLLQEVARQEAGIDEVAWLEALRTVLDRQVLDERAAGQFRFVHDRLREIAWHRIPEARRHMLHHLVAERIEASCAAHNDHPQHYRALAHHWTQANVLPRAIEYLDKAGMQALDTFANNEAVAFLSEVLVLAARDGASIDVARRARVERSLAEARLRLGNLSEGRAHAERALQLCQRPMPVSTPRWVGGLLMQSGIRLWRSLFRVSNRVDDVLALEAAHTFFRMMEVFLYGNDPLRGVYCGLRTLNVAEALPTSQPLARGYAMMAVMLAATPLRAIGTSWSEHAIDLAESLNAPSTIAYCLSRAGVTLIHEARWSRAEELLQRGIELCRLIGDKRQLEECQAILGNGLFYRSAFEESRQAWRDVLRSANERNDPQIACWGRLGQAVCLLRMGRFDEALTTLDEAMPWVDAHAASADVLWAYGLLALARLRVGRREEARAAADKALAQMLRSMPVVYWVQPALAGVVEVYNDLCFDAKGAARDELLAVGQQAARVLQVFSWSFQFARPAALFQRGKRLLALGQGAKAVRTWHRGLTVARELGMRYEEAQLLRALADHDPTGDKVALRAQALTLFESLGAAADVAALRAPST